MVTLYEIRVTIRFQIHIGTPFNEAKRAAAIEAKAAAPKN
jgi:hypothetical protein